MDVNKKGERRKSISLSSSMSVFKEAERKNEPMVSKEE